MHQYTRQLEAKTWWAGIWRGLVVDSKAKHYKAMRSALWLFGYFIIHADRRTGTLFRKQETIARDMGVKTRTVRYWLATLRRHGYVKIENSSGSSSIFIHIQKWKPLKTPQG
jgi:beta-phosphoglucomutase-like phosphatase (HAD superfamily)